MRVIKPSYSIERLDEADVVFKRIERAGRTCYKSEDRITDESARQFIKMLIARGHLSVIEHESMTVRFICDRGFTHELVRHRLVSYSQESTRYCNYSKAGFDNQITVIDRCYWDKTDPRYDYWFDACQIAERAYMHLIEIKATPEEARAVLPIGLKTEIVATANLREWGHIFYQRTSERAHPQMRELMIPLLAEMRERLPIIYDDLSIYR